MFKEIDNKINWPQFYGGYIKGLKKTGSDKMVGPCPFHNDKHASFWFNTEKGLFKCETCGKSGNGQVFLQEIENIDGSTAYKKLLKLAGEYDEPVIKKVEKTLKSYTLEEYAAAKHFPIDYLKNNWKLRNVRLGISMPYLNSEGEITATRLRYINKIFRWSKGSKMSLYGLQQLPAIKKKGYCILVEGESDNQTLTLYGIPALGVPGATTFQASWTEQLQGLTIYIHDERDLRKPETPDSPSGSENFIKKICDGLYSEKFVGEVYTLSCKTQGVKDPSDLHIKYASDFEDKWNAVFEAAQPIDLKSMAVQVEELIPGAPIQLRSPIGFRINESGIYKVDDKTGILAQVCRTPILLTSRMKSLDFEDEKMEVAFFRDKKWQTISVQRSIIFQSRTITMLADMGVTVTSENARGIVSFLGALEAENIEIMPIKKTVSQLGWYSNNFMPTRPGKIVVDVDRSAQKWVNAYRACGTMAQWTEKIQPYRNNYTFRFILAASFAAPLLKPLKHRTFFVHNWGDSRGGKTAALKAALSVWGDPDELMTSFNATKVGLERIAGFFNDLPLGIDERQVASGKQDFIDNLVYMISNGTSKLRGAKAGGVQASKSWRTIALTTGEEPLTTLSSQTGVATRAIEICGSPFDAEEGARNMHDISTSYFGTAGAEFINKLVDTFGKDYEPLRKSHKTLQEKFQTQFPDKLGSHVSAVSLVTIADMLISKWIFKSDPAESYDMGAEILDKLEGTEEADVVERAFEFVTGWLHSNSSQFSIDAHAPRFGSVESEIYYIFPQIMQKALEDAGYSYKKTMRGFADRGKCETKIETDGRMKYTVVKRFEGKVSRYIVIDMSDKETTISGVTRVTQSNTEF